MVVMPLTYSSNNFNATFSPHLHRTLFGSLAIISKSRFFILCILSSTVPAIKLSMFPLTPQFSNQLFLDILHTGRASRLVFLCQIKARDCVDFLRPIPQ